MAEAEGENWGRTAGGGMDGKTERKQSPAVQGNESEFDPKTNCVF